jgi:hypothetical protein
MAEMGHADPELALWVYAQAMRRDEREAGKLRGLVDGGFRGRIGANEPSTGSEAVERQAA